MVYAGGMAQPAHNYDTAASDLVASVGHAVGEAENGKVTYLHRQEQETIAVMPASLAYAALEALEDAEDAALAKEALARRTAGERGIPLSTLKAETEAELAA